MRRYFLLIIIAIYANLVTFAQSISLEVDCQNPGWLSNKLTYLEQQNVMNLKVTGYLNSTDLKFIGTLMGNNLKGRLDLSEAIIVKDENLDNNEFIHNAFSLKNDAELDYLELPKTLTKISQLWDLTGNKFTIDTLVIGSSNTPNIHAACFANNANFKNIVIREGVEKISDDYYNSRNAETRLKNIRKITLPSTFKSIPCAFLANSSTINSLNFPDSIEEIGEFAFASTKFLPETIYMPKELKTFHFNILYNALPKSLYLPSNVTKITNKEYYQYNYIPILTSATMEIHIKSSQVPTLDIPSGTNSTHAFCNCTIFVPSNLVDTYKNTAYYKNANIQAEKEITNISINNKTTNFYVGENYQFSATYEPLDATDKLIKWTCNNNDIASVSEDGKLECKKYGKATINASTSYNTINNNIDISIFEHTVGVDLNKKELEMKVGDVIGLVANTLPLNVSDGKVSWSSSDDNIASIDSLGNISAHKAGKCTITCTTTDRNYKETCNIVVIQPVGGIEITDSTYTITGLGKTYQLVANVLPADATNKEITWTSSDNSVCIVVNGLIVSIGYGTATITAKSVDGGYAASCTINIKEDATGIDDITFNPANNQIYHIYTLDGQISDIYTKGIKIIKFSNGNTKKIVIN